MKKKRQKKMKAIRQQDWHNKEEVLNLDELMDVQGGIEKDLEKEECGLGCFPKADYEVDPKDSVNSNHE